jgi:hypothetical protein
VEEKTAIQLVCKKMTREELILFYFRKAEVKKGWRGEAGRRWKDGFRNFCP